MYSDYIPILPVTVFAAVGDHVVDGSRGVVPVVVRVQGGVGGVEATSWGGGKMCVIGKAVTLQRLCCKKDCDIT